MASRAMIPAIFALGLAVCGSLAVALLLFTGNAIPFVGGLAAAIIVARLGGVVPLILLNRRIAPRATRPAETWPWQESPAVVSPASAAATGATGALVYAPQVPGGYRP